MHDWPKFKTSHLLGLIILISLLVTTRFSVRPAVGFVLDDWAMLRDAIGQGSTWDVFSNGLKSPTRPFGTGLQQTLFRLFLERVALYEGMSIVCYSMALLLVYLIARELTGREGIAFAGSVLFAVLPNVCGHFHWICLTVSPGQLVYLLSAWLLVRHVRRAEKWSLGGAVFWYAVGLGTYEVGAFLPGAYAVLLWRRGWKKCLAALLPFGIALGVYAAWRLTAGFGMLRDVGVAPQFNAGLSLYGVKHTAADIVSWWAGLDWWRAVGDGATGFSELPWPKALALWVANVVLVILSGVWLWRTNKREEVEDDPNTQRDGFGDGTLAVFGVAWVAAAYVPVFLGYLAPRLNYLPGAGLAFLAAVGLGRMKMERWLGVVLTLVFAGMVVGEGDTKNWSDTIRFQRNLYETMKERRAEWENAEVLWLDTRELSHRLTPGLLSDNRHHIDTVAEYRNTGLLRGFAPSAMARLILDGKPGPQVILDVEYGAREEDGVLKWHERYNPKELRETPMNRVYRLNVFEAGLDKFSFR